MTSDVSSPVAAQDAAHPSAGHPSGPPRSRSLLASLAESAKEVWEFRPLLYQLTLRDIRIRYKQAIMGFGWAILMPMLIVLSGVIVRYAMAYLSGTELNAEIIAGLAIRSIPWAFFVGAIQFASGTLTGNMNLVTKIYFPREVLPLSATLAQSFDSAVGLLSLLVALPILGVRFSPTVLWALPLLAALFLLTVGLALLLSCANLFFRDVKYIVRVLLTFGIFFTPVFFEPEMFGPVGARLMMLNPLAPILEGMRLSVIEHHNLLTPLVLVGDGTPVVAWAPWYLGYAAVSSLGSVVLGTWVFQRLESLFAEYI